MKMGNFERPVAHVEVGQVGRHARTGFKITFLSNHLHRYLFLGKRNIPYSHLTNCSVEVSAIA